MRWCAAWWLLAAVLAVGLVGCGTDSDSWAPGYRRTLDQLERAVPSLKRVGLDESTRCYTGPDGWTYYPYVGRKYKVTGRMTIPEAQSAAEAFFVARGIPVNPPESPSDFNSGVTRKTAEIYMDDVRDDVLNVVLEAPC